MPVLYQLLIFALEIAWGVVAGFLFDCYYQTRKVWRTGHWSTSLGDFLFWVLLTALTALYLMRISWGEVRVYVFLAMGFGFLIYVKLFRRPVHQGGTVVWRLINSFRRGSRSFLLRCRILKRK